MDIYLPKKDKFIIPAQHQHTQNIKHEREKKIAALGFTCISRQVIRISFVLFNSFPKRQHYSCINNAAKCLEHIFSCLLFGHHICIHTQLSHSPPHLFLRGTEVSRTARTCALHRTRSPPGWRCCGSCCSWGLWWPQSWGSAVVWGQTHTGSPSCVRGWSPGHQWV